VFQNKAVILHLNVRCLIYAFHAWVSSEVFKPLAQVWVIDTDI